MDEALERRRQWELMHQKEQARRRGITALQELVEKMGESQKSAKTLLKLSVYTEGVKADEAADILGVKRSVINAWVRILVSRGFVDVESLSHPNPTIRPTIEILNKFRAYQNRAQEKDLQKIEEGMKDMGEAVKTLETEGVVKAEAAPPEAPEPQEADLDIGVTYLIYEPKSERAVRLFIKEIRAGVKGLYVTRSNPNQVKRRVYLGDAKVVWLTSVQTDRDVESISGLQELSILVSKFIDENPTSAILLEGVEYLVSNNNFQVVLRLIQQLRDKVSTSDSKMLIPLNPNALEQRQLPLLEGECQILR